MPIPVSPSLSSSQQKNTTTMVAVPLWEMSNQQTALSPQQNLKT